MHSYFTPRRRIRARDSSSKQGASSFHSLKHSAQVHHPHSPQFITKPPIPPLFTTGFLPKARTRWIEAQGQVGARRRRPGAGRKQLKQEEQIYKNCKQQIHKNYKQQPQHHHTWAQVDILSLAKWSARCTWCGGVFPSAKHRNAMLKSSQGVKSSKASVLIKSKASAYASWARDTNPPNVAKAYKLYLLEFFNCEAQIQYLDAGHKTHKGRSTTSTSMHQ